MRTLLVHYTPRGTESVTKRLLDAFRLAIRGSEIDERDLCAHPPTPLDASSAVAYGARNMYRTPLSEAQRVSLREMDECTKQLKSANIVVVAFPMYNFSLPAAVKAWFDLILQVGETVDPRGGVYTGLMERHRAVILAASGGVYSRGNGTGPFFGPSWDHAVPLARQLFEFMGYSRVDSVLAEGTAGFDPAAIEERVTAAALEARRIASSLYDATSEPRTRRKELP